MPDDEPTQRTIPPSKKKPEPLDIPIPTRGQVDARTWRALAEEYKLDPARFDREAPNRRLGAFLAGEGLPALDLLLPLRKEAPRSLPLYFRRKVRLSTP